jgi:hypothetical protein
MEESDGLGLGQRASFVGWTSQVSTRCPPGRAEIGGGEVCPAAHVTPPGTIRSGAFALAAAGGATTL